ncbi:MAG: DUF1156 domain-containing protein [Acidimicrobiaceae bacterium]|nr:DUF1156 domain-containing protein [Acidimicrobiaceae bacterium]
MTGDRPKLIEVALPLAAINEAAAREKMGMKHARPSTLHLWWARRPLAATRAVIWASLVDDPLGDESLTSGEQKTERQRLFGILERLVVWENSNNPEVLAEANAEIDRCFPDGPPPILDPLAGGGAIPLEAQRLGLEALAGDLNPVAALINKAMIEIPPRFAGMPPVHPSIEKTLTTWERAQGLAADVEAYGQWMRDEAKRRIGHLYPDATGLDGEKLTPIAWIWARTVASPDPSWSGHVPLVAWWVLANRPGKPKVWVETIIDRDTQTISYEIRLTVWEALQYLVAALERLESEAAELLRQLGGYADRASQLAYVLYQKANDKGWTTEAGAYNALITAWPILATAAATPVQAQMFSS